MIIGYARVSTDEQDAKNQEHEIKRHLDTFGLGACDKIISESISSRSDKREIYTLVKELRAGDVLVCTELSRIGRSLIDLRTIFDSIIAKGVRLILIKHNLDLKPEKTKNGFELSDPMQKMMINMLGMFAEFERDIIKERTVKAIKSKQDEAEATGKEFKIGRPKGSTGFHEPEKVAKAKKLFADGYKKKHICSSLGISFPTLQDYLRSA